MGWTSFAEAEAALGTRLARKVSSGTLPTHTDAGGQRWVWLQEGAERDDVLWEVLAELRRLREALSRLEVQVAGSPLGARARPAAATPERVVSTTTGTWRRLEAGLEPHAEAA